LTGIDPRVLDDLIRSGAIGTEWIKNRLYVVLEDVERAAAAAPEEDLPC
jgi:hypothetical protein